MYVQPQHLFTPETRPRVPTGVVLISILGFWLFYVAIVTLRAGVMDFPAQGEMALRRGFVTALGIVVTIVLWLFMRSFDRQPLGIRISAAVAGAVPAAFAIAGINYYFFNVYDPAGLLDVERMKQLEEVELHMWKEIAEVAISRYFFLIAWASLYLALSYAAEVQSAERRTAEFAQAAQSAELRSLRYQVNPHFLFNTLNSLSALVMTGRPKEAETMIQNISTFYRTSLSGDPTDDVSLAEEVRLQELYLDIEGVRFPQRLKTVIDIPEALKEACVPGLILQPLVENAVKHGVSRTTKPVTVSIVAREEAGRLVLRVTDDGPGPGDPAQHAGSGIGLANVRDRLVTRFGADATISTEALAAGGFATTLTLPLVRNGC